MDIQIWMSSEFNNYSTNMISNNICGIYQIRIRIRIEDFLYGFGFRYCTIRFKFTLFPLVLGVILPIKLNMILDQAFLI